MFTANFHRFFARPVASSISPTYIVLGVLAALLIAAAVADDDDDDTTVMGDGDIFEE